MNNSKKSEEKFRLLFDTIPDALYIIDQETGKILDVNKAAEKMYGYSREEWLQMKNTDVSAEPDKTKKATYNLPSHIPIRYHKKKDGTIFPIEMVVSSYTLNGQRLIIATGRDITERIKSEEELKKYHDQLEDLVEERTIALRDSEAEINAIYNHIPAIIILVDEERRVQKVNKLALQFSGRIEEEILGLRGGEALRCLNSLDDPQGCGFGPQCQFCMVRNTVLDTFKTGKAVYGIEYALPFIKEQKRVELHLLISTTPLTIKGKNMVLVSINDISDLKLAQSALNVSEKKYRSLVEDSQEGVWALDKNENITFVNPRICEMLGYTKDEMMGENRDLFIPDSMKERLKGNRIRREKGIKETYDLELLKKDGTSIYTNIKAAPIMSESRDYKGSFAYITDITIQKHAEDTLRESEEKFRTISEQSLMGILILQNDMYKYVNQALADMFGYTVEELMNTSQGGFMNYIHPEDREFVREQATKKQNGMKDVITTYSYRGLTKSGEIIWVQLYSCTITFEGKFADLITIVDFTERKKAQKALKESEELFRTMYNAAPISISILDIDGIIIEANPAHIKQIATSRENIIGKHFTELYTYPPPYDQIVMGMFCTLQIGEVPKPVEIKFITYDGVVHWEYLSTVLVNIGGNPLIFAINQDITELKKVEQNLIESEQKYRALFENSPIGVSLSDYKGNAIAINEYMKKIFGYEIEELQKLGIPATYADAQDRISFKNLLEEQGYVKDYEVDLKRKDGKIFPALVNSNKTTISGEPIYISIIKDITEKKEIEAIKTQLLTRFSHEFKTPLISIKGFSDLLLSEYKYKLDEKTIGFLERIKKGANRLNVLINAFMESSQLGEKLTNLNKNKENLSDLIKLGVSEMEGLISLRKHAINVDIPEELIGEFDKEKIYTVINNLLMNAINYTPPGGKIFIHSKIEDGDIFFSIQDNGIGLMEEDKRHLFKSFGKIEKYGKGWDIVSEGMGVGLYLSKEIISLHGGKIWAESEGENKGSTFYFSLPKP